MVKTNFVVKTEDLTATRRTPLLLLGIMVFCVVSFVLMYQSFNKVKLLRSEINDQNKKLSNLTTKLDYLQSLNKHELAGQVETLEAVFPSEKPVMNLINTIRTIALDNGVSYQGIKLSPGLLEETARKKKKPGQEEDLSVSKLEESHIELSLVGSLDNIINFIEQAKKTAPLASVDSLTISTLAEQQDLVSAKITVLVYYQAPPQTIGKIDEPLQVLTPEDEKLFSILKDYKIYASVEPRSGITGKENFFQQP